MKKEIIDITLLHLENFISQYFDTVLLCGVHGNNSYSLMYLFNTNFRQEKQQNKYDI